MTRTSSSASATSPPPIGSRKGCRSTSAACSSMPCVRADGRRSPTWRSAICSWRSTASRSTDVEAVQAKMTQIASRKPASVVFRVKRGIRTFFVELQGSWKN